MREAFTSVTELRTPTWSLRRGDYQVFGRDDLAAIPLSGTAGAKPASRCGMYRMM